MAAPAATSNLNRMGAWAAARLAVVVAAFVVFLPVAAGAADLRVASWNALHLGWNNGKNYEAMAEVVQHFDLLAVQEVMKEEGVAALSSAVEARTGESWSFISSHLVGRNGYEEMYTFLWRDSAVRYVDGAVIYLDRRDVFVREPFAARFEAADGTLRFVMATVHAVYGDDESERQAEAAALGEYWTWLRSVFPDEDVLVLSGDFNLEPRNPAWGPLRSHAVPLIVSGATTLARRDGAYANLYDNLWVSPRAREMTKGAGILGYPRAILNWDHATARNRVSDHAPVWMVLTSGRATEALPPASPAGLPNEAPAETVVRDASKAPVIGNRNSMIFHWEGCPGYDKTAPANAVPFASREAAASAGYRAARNCR